MRWRDIKKGKKAQKRKEKKSEIDKKFASIPDRVKAFITDSFMILMPIIYIVIYLVMGSREEFRDNMLSGWIYIIIPHFLITILFWRLKGQTPGMKAYDLELVEIISLKRASLIGCILRYFLTTLSLITIFPLLIAFFRKDKRTLHDLLSGSYIKYL